MITLALHYSRYGVVVTPILPSLGFDYNRVYFSVDAVLKDFELHGWTVESQHGEMYGNNPLFVVFKKLPHW
jgi:hypothetical protein